MFFSYHHHQLEFSGILICASPIKCYVPFNCDLTLCFSNILPIFYFTVDFSPINFSTFFYKFLVTSPLSDMFMFDTILVNRLMVSSIFIMVAVWSKQQASSNPLNILSSLMKKTFNSSSIDIALNILIFEYIGKYTEDHRFLFCGLFIFNRLYFIFCFKIF